LGSNPGTRQPLAFRVSPETLEHLKRRAHETASSQTDLAERYIQEGLRMDEHHLIQFRDGAMGRRPSLTGTRLDVFEVVQIFNMNGKSIEETARYLELPTAHVESSLRYYAAYQEEIDKWIARAEAVSEREETLWLRQQKLAG